MKKTLIAGAGPSRGAAVLVVLFLGILILAPRIGANEPTVASRIDSVTVYADRALVTRVADAELKRGKNMVVLDDFPVSLLSDSLRVSGKSAKPVTILSIKNEIVRQAEVDDVVVRELAARLEELAAREKALNDELEVLACELDYYKSVTIDPQVQIPEGETSKVSTADDWRKIVEFVRGGIENVYAGRRKVEDELAELKKDISVARGKLKTASAGKHAAKNVVSIGVEASSATTVELSVSYIMLYATWAATYDVRLDSARMAVELTYEGVIVQKTGEDWENVKVTLSTAAAEIEQSMPELTKLAYARMDPRVAALGDDTGPGIWFNDASDGDLRARIENLFDNTVIGQTNGSAGATQPARLEKLYHLGRVAFEGREYDKARRLAELILYSEPMNYEAQKLRAAAIRSGGIAAATEQNSDRAREWKATFEHVEELTIPYHELIRFPERQKWEAVKTRASRMDDFSLATADLWAIAGFGSADFAIPARSSIPSDNSPHKVTVAIAEFAGNRIDFHYRATPLLLEKAFLFGETVNRADYPLIPGSMNIFVDASYTGRGLFAGALPGEKFTLSLGTDEGVRIGRKRLEKEIDADKSRRGKTRYEYSYEIEVENYKPFDIDVRLFDRTPVCDNSDVVIRLSEISPNPVDAERKDGILEWRIAVPSGGKSKAAFAYNVRHPNSIEVGGLE